jgi:DNA helicase-2/ATP-dependent DNA helicase PcrA
MSREEFPGVVGFTDVDPFLLTPGDREAIEGAPPEVRTLVEGRALTALHQTVLRYLDVNRADGHRVFDQDDMLWLPTELGLPMPRYDVIFIDEAQDLSEVQIRMLMGLVRAGAHVVAVGDKFQRIYEFRGVKHDTFDRLITMLDACVLPLSITYRCGSAIVDEVRKRFCHIPLEAGPSNPAANVEHFTALPVGALLPGDMVISRSNAPLLAACIEALRRGIPSAILGKDFAKAMLEPLARAKKEVGSLATPKQTVESIRARLIRDLQEQAEGAEEIGEDADEFVDRIECYQMLFAGCSSIEEVERLLTRSHVDKTTSRQVTFTTVHKAKGLEARRVFVLLHTFHPADQNLLYVAMTRAKEYLAIVEEKKKQCEPAPCSVRWPRHT